MLASFRDCSETVRSDQCYERSLDLPSPSCIIFGLSRPSEQVSWWLPIFFSSGRQEPHVLISAPCDRTCAHHDTSHYPYHEHDIIFSCQLMRDNHAASRSAILPLYCLRALQRDKPVYSQDASLLFSKNLAVSFSLLLRITENPSTSPGLTAMPAEMFTISGIRSRSSPIKTEAAHFSRGDNSER